MSKRRIVLGVAAVFVCAGAGVCFGEPVIEVTPGELNFIAVEGGSNPAAQILYISNSGTGKLEWEIFEDCPWLSVDPVSGSCVDETDEILVSVDITSLLGGQYTCELIVSDPDAANSPQVLTVNLYMDEIILEVPSEYLTIQSAIDAADDGDTVIVDVGTYVENINFGGKNIVLTSTNPDDPNIVEMTVINGGGLGSVVTFDGTEDSNCTLTGFTITEGYNSYGGGLFGNYTHATISNCVIMDNTADYGGGGLSRFSGLISNCKISGNAAEVYQLWGGGLSSCIGTIENCTITNNTAKYAGGLYSCYGTINNCTITGNIAEERGGGLYNFNGTISNCTITGNISKYDGGGLYYCNGTISNCTITGNTSTNYGGGLCDCNETISNCIIIGNSSKYGGGLYNCGGTIENCAITDNTADYGGGGLYGCDGTMSHCRIVGNMAYRGGGLYNCGGSIENCTVTGNTADYYGGGLYDCDGTIVNCIVAKNNATANDQLYSCTVPTYSCIEGGYGDGEGNIDADPLFVDTSSEDPSEWDLHLQTGSPCIDTGTNEPQGGLPETDMDGNPRLTDGNYDGIETVDMGIYETPQSQKSVLGIKGPIEFRIYEGQLNFLEEPVFIRNTGLSTLIWNCDESCEWLSVEPISGVIPPEEQMEVILSLDVTGLAVGLYTCELVFSDPNAVNHPKVIEVLLGIRPADGNLWVPYQFDTIQEAINAAADSNEVVVADGIYTGNGNRDIDFLGKAITVRSQNGPPNCIIDCQGSSQEPHRGFYFESGEDADSILNGFTIQNGYGPQERDDYGYYHSFGGGVYCQSPSSPMIINCVFSGNTADAYGGGFSCGSNCAPILANCSFLGNDASWGGGAYCYKANLTAVNCIFAGNNASDRGGALFCYHNDGGNVRLTNCTITGNTAYSYDAVYANIESLTITNCILWDNGENSIWSADNTVVQYSNIEGGRDGEGNIDVEPLFVDVASENPDEWDLHLQPVSLCIDAGSNEADGELVPIDIEGNPRIVDGDNDGVSIVDMGVYEMPLPEAPVIWLSETEFDFMTYEGGPNPAEQTLEICNRSVGTLNWHVSEDCDWLTVTPENGSSVGEWDQVSLSIDVTGLTFGVHTCEIAIVDTNAFNNPAIVQAVLRVAPVDDYVWVPYEHITIQSAIDAAADGDEIVIADGVYTGLGNRDIDFLGKAITVRSENGPDNCIIDCQGSSQKPHRGFYFHSGEVEGSVLDGFTVINGYNSGGAVYVYGRDYDCTPTIRNCVFRDNQGASGGAVSCSSLSGPKIVNCLFICNTVEGRGGGVRCNGGSVLLQNCTFTGNSAETGGAVSYSDNAYVKIVNSILWQNSGEEIAGYGMCSVSHSNVEGGYIGISNINSAPGFINTTSEDSADWDLHLSPGSPCIDAGLNTPDWEMPDTDIEGNVRITDGDNDGVPIVDMGAYESTLSAEPVIRLSSFGLQFSCWLDDEYMDEEVLSIRNGGSGTLNWEIVEDCDWLEVIPAGGSSTGEVNEVVVRADRTTLGTGVYECILMVTSPDAINSPLAVTVKFTIGDRLDVPAEYLTIQDAINAAADLDAVVIADGIYTGDGNRDIDFLGKAITVRSQNGPDACIIDCQGSRLDEHRGFVFQNGEDPNSVLDGVTIINGWAPGSSTSYYTGGDGGGILCSASSPTIKNCVLKDNLAGGGGGGIYLSYFSYSVIEDCIIENNSSASRGGGILGSSSNIVVKGCVIRGNTGGGVYFTSSRDIGNCVLDSCLIVKNKSFVNGGGVGSSSTSVGIVNCTIANNTAEHYGGGVSGQWESDIELVNCIVWGNRAEFGNQFALTEVAPNEESYWVDTGSVISIRNCNVEDRQAGTFTDEKCSIDWGDGIVDVEPGFVLEGDYHLSAGSVCIDAGLVGCSGSATDIDGNVRVIDGDGQAGAAIDLGAYEYNPDAPSIGLSRRLVEVSIPVGTIEPHEEIVSIANAGGGILQWEAFEDCLWLSVEPDSGVCEQETNDFSIRIDPAALVEGVNQCLITVSAAGAVNSPQIIEVDVKYYRTLHIPSEYEFICDAVDAANDGDVVIVDDGEYDGYYNYTNFQGKAITVRSKNGPANCIIDCSGFGRAFSFISGEGQDSVLSGFTIANAGDPYFGVIRCENSGPTIRNCVFSNNKDEIGTIFCRKSNPTITNCIFNHNEPFSGGGAIYCESGGSVVRRCIFKENRSSYPDYPERDGGGICCIYGGIKITDCTFENNRSNYGGAIYDYYGSVMVLDCVFEGNNSSIRGGAIYINQGSLTLEDCSFSGNYTRYNGGAIGSRYTKTRIEDCSFSRNSSAGSSGALSLHSGPSYIKRCGFYDNSCDSTGGAAVLDWGSMDNCVFSGNRASSRGGAIDTSMTVSNCTFVGNTAVVEGGAIYHVREMSNCILWDNLPDQILYSHHVSYCNVQGGFEGEGNIDIEPDFVQAGYWDDKGTPTDPHDDFWVDGDYRLRWGSPCIDAGDPNFVAEEGQTDFADSDRLVDGDGDGEAFVDMGAYEFENMPRLYVEPETIIFNASGGVIEPAEQVLAIQNVGSGVLDWLIVTDAQWLLADSFEGGSSGEIDFVTLSVDTDGMEDGLYRCKLRVHSSNALDSPGIVEVILAIGDSQWLFVPAEYNSIQDAIDAAIGGDTVLVMDGTYTGPGNRDIDFGGKAVTVRSLNGPQDCIIDCQASSSEQHRGFIFTSGEDANSVLEGFTIKNGYASPFQFGDQTWYAGGGILCIQSSPTIKNCVLYKNNGNSEGGGMFCYDGSNPVISDCVFCKNVAYYGGGGLKCLECSPVIQNCRFVDNYAGYDGGGISCSTSSALIEGCVFTGNYGGGLSCHYSSDCMIFNCVFIDNSESGANISISKSNPTISNCITFMEGIEIFSGEPTITYCNIDGGYEGIGNIDELPLFVDYIRGDYHLRWDSPCVDAGDPDFVGEEGEVDIDGEPRVMGGRVDMGADEVGERQADFTRDGRIDIDDFAVFSRSWDTAQGEVNWYILSDLFEDGAINLSDVAIFASDWLWVADWAN